LSGNLKGGNHAEDISITYFEIILCEYENCIEQAVEAFLSFPFLDRLNDFTE
jgi:hypothetical protein